MSSSGWHELLKRQAREDAAAGLTSMGARIAGAADRVVYQAAYDRERARMRADTKPAPADVEARLNDNEKAMRTAMERIATLEADARTSAKLYAKLRASRGRQVEALEAAVAELRAAQKTAACAPKKEYCCGDMDGELLSLLSRAVKGEDVTSAEADALDAAVQAYTEAR